MSQHLKIEVIGRDGSEWVISGPGYGQQGVILKPKVSQFIDAPVKTLFVPGPFGEEFAGKRVQRREMVFTVQVGGEDMTPEEWADTDARWRWAWDYQEESVMRVTVLDNVGSQVYPPRFINLRLLEEPKSYGEKDPYLTSDNEVVMTVTATFPYWRAADLQLSWATGSSAGSKTFNIANNGDVEVFPRWALTAPGIWTLPDYSWGSGMYGRAVADANRTVQLPELPDGADASVDSDPRVQTIVCVNKYPAQQQWAGKDLLYPIQPGASGPFVLSVSGASGGAAAVLTVPRWYSRPWSSPVSLL